MTQLDTDTARIVTRLVDLQAQIADLTSEAEGLKSELRNTLNPGDHNINGAPALRIIPNRRFNVDFAAGLLGTEQRKECLVVTYDATKVKRHLTPVEVEECMVEAGKPKVVLI